MKMKALDQLIADYEVFCSALLNGPISARCNTCEHFGKCQETIETFKQLRKANSEKGPEDDVDPKKFEVDDNAQYLRIPRNASRHHEGNTE